MEIEGFKSNLNKGQLNAMAIDKANDLNDTDVPIEAHIWLKRAKFFIDTLIKENQKNALMIWEQVKSDYPNITHTNGKRTYDFKGIAVWVEMKSYLTDIEKLSKMAIDSKTPVQYVHPFTGEVITINKPGVKESSETLNVKI